MSVTEATISSWAEANHRYLLGELQRLRLLVKRRVLWLRKQWAAETSSAFQGLAISEATADRLLAGEDFDAVRRFYSEDSRAVAINAALAHQEQELTRQKRTLQDQGHVVAVDVLVRLLDLSAFERDLLLLCLAPEIDPAFERIYAYVQDDVTRKYATLHLAMMLLCDSEAAWLTAWEQAGNNGSLRRFRLVTTEPGATAPLSSTTEPLRLSSRAAGYLLGVNRLDAGLAGYVRQVPLLPLSPDHEALVERLQDWVLAQRRQGAWPAINLVGPPGAGKKAVARALADRLSLRILQFDGARVPATAAEASETGRCLAREAVLLQCALYVDAGRIDRGGSIDARSHLNAVIDQLDALVVVGSKDPWSADRSMVTLSIAKPGADGQGALWRQALAGEASFDCDVDALAQQFDFGPTAIYRAVAAARAQAFLRDSRDVPPSAADLWQACNEQTHSRLEELALHVVPAHAWEDIVLPSDSLDQLREIAAQVAHRSRVYKDWGFGSKLNRGRGISALFSGPSGTGKTLAAEILAHHLDLRLYRIDLSGVVSKYIGETEKNLRQVFDAAEQSGAILFFDEADALFGKRSEVKDSHDRYANIEVNYLLQRMEDYQGLAILATNMKSYIDQAFLRRLRFLVDFPFPDTGDRARIWRRVFPPAAPLDGIDYTALSRLEIPGGNIKNIAVNSAFLASAEEAPIRMTHIAKAARREYAKIERLAREDEFRAIESPQQHEGSGLWT